MHASAKICSASFGKHNWQSFSMQLVGSHVWHAIIADDRRNRQGQRGQGAGPEGPGSGARGAREQGQRGQGAGSEGPGSRVRGARQRAQRARPAGAHVDVGGQPEVLDVRGRSLPCSAGGQARGGGQASSAGQPAPALGSSLTNDPTLARGRGAATSGPWRAPGPCRHPPAPLRPRTLWAGLVAEHIGLPLTAPLSGDVAEHPRLHLHGAAVVDVRRRGGPHRRQD